MVIKEIQQVTNPMFTFDIEAGINLSYVTLNLPESWIDKDDFKLPHKIPLQGMREVTNQINIKIEKYVIPELENCLTNNNYTLITGQRKFDKYGNGTICKVPGEDVLSYACYFDIKPNDFNIDCSESVTSSIGTFIIRLANHISDSEYKTLANPNNVKFFVQNIDNLYAEKFIKCTENVLNSYTNFLNYLRNYDKRLEKFSDIPVKEVAKLKRIQKQGF